MLVFRKTWRALFSCYHRLEIRLFALLYRRFVLFYLTLYNINNILCKKKDTKADASGISVTGFRKRWNCAENKPVNIKEAKSKNILNTKFLQITLWLLIAGYLFSDYLLLVIMILLINFTQF